MKRLPFLFLVFLFFLPAISLAKELPKIAVWDLTSGDIKGAYAQDLTLILASEVSKLGKYEVYSQENVRTLAGWTAERMTLGCTDTKCLTALGQMDIAKLISGRVGRIGKRFSISLSLFDTQNAKAEKMISDFCQSEDELIELVQVAARKLLGEEMLPPPPPMPSPPQMPPTQPLYDDFASWDSSKWEGNKWCRNISQGSWAPTVKKGYATFAIDDYCWGVIRSTKLINKGQTVEVTLTPRLNSGGVNNDWALILLSTNWVMYSSPDAIGLVLDDRGVVKVWSQANGDIAKIGTYRSGSVVSISLTLNKDGTLTMRGGGGIYKTPSAPFQYSTPRIVIAEKDSADGFDVHTVKISQ